MMADPAHDPPPATGTVLVTGGTGFLGRRLVERLLESGRRVTILARRADADLQKRGARFICSSIDEAQRVAAAWEGAETVFHVAAKVGVWGKYQDFHRTNVLGTQAVLAGCRTHGIKRLVYTSSPSVVYNGKELSGADESLPLTIRCPSPYPLTKAIAERTVLAANSPGLRTIALRPHLIWGVGDPHLVPRLLERARSGRLRIIGDGRNRVDLVHIENAVDAHLLAERALIRGSAEASRSSQAPEASGRPYFITNGEPVALWTWIAELLAAAGAPPLRKRLSLGAASTIGLGCELAWRLFRLAGEPPMTRFVAAELAKDHWFDISAARRDLGYVPRVTMAEGTAELIKALKRSEGGAA